MDIEINWIKDFFKYFIKAVFYCIAFFFLKIEITSAETINTQQFKFNPNLTYEFVESSNLYDPFMGYIYPNLFAFNYNYITNPFVVQQSQTNERLTNVLQDIKSFQFGYQHQLTDWMDHRWSASVVGTINQTRKVFDPEELRAVDDAVTVLGDTYLGLKYRVLESNKMILSLKGELGLGTGNREYFQSDGYTIGGMVIGEWLGNRYRLAANWGFRYAGEAQYGNVDYRRLIQFAGGAFYSFNRTFGGTVEAKKDFGLSSVTGSSVSGPGEFHIGLQKKIMNEGWTMFGSVGSGALPIFSSSVNNGSEFRLSIGLKYTPKMEAPSGYKIKTTSLSFEPQSTYQKKFSHKYTEPQVRELLYKLHNQPKKKPVAKKLTPVEQKQSEVTHYKEGIKKEKDDLLLIFSNYITLRQNLEKAQIELAQIENSKSIQSSRSIASDSLGPSQAEMCDFVKNLKNLSVPKITFSNEKMNLNEGELSHLDSFGDFILRHFGKINKIKVIDVVTLSGAAEANNVSKGNADKVINYLNDKVKYGMHYENQQIFIRQTNEIRTMANSEVKLELVPKPFQGGCP